MAQGIFTQLADGSLVDVNPAALEMFGLDRDQFFGRTSFSPGWKVVNEEGVDLPPEHHPSMVALRTGLPVSDAVVGVYNPTMTTYVWLIVNAIPIFREGDDSPYMVFVTLHDTTKRLEMEQELREKKTKLQNILDNSSEWIWEMDLTGKHIYSNPQFIKLLGYDLDELIGKSYSDFLHEDDLLEVNKILPQLIAKRTGWEGWILRWRHKDGSYRHFESNAKPVINHVGEFIGYSGADRDITDRKNAEEVLRKLDKAKSDFIRIAAHELKTPLTSILGFAEILGHSEQTLSNDQHKQFTSLIIDNAETLSRLVDDLLDVERIELNSCLQLEKRETSFAELIEKTVASITPEHPDHRFVLTGTDSLPAIINIDDRRIIQVLYNLLSNAVKYSPKGGTIEISTTTTESSVITSVKDYGLGMEPENLEFIFDKFYRARPDDPNFSGLGLGMYIVKNIVEEHGGEISVSSLPEKGTTVTFSLPIL